MRRKKNMYYFYKISPAGEYAFKNFLWSQDANSFEEHNPNWVRTTREKYDKLYVQAKKCKDSEHMNTNVYLFNEQNGIYKAFSSRSGRRDYLCDCIDTNNQLGSEWIIVNSEETLMAVTKDFHRNKEIKEKRKTTMSKTITNTKNTTTTLAKSFAHGTKVATADKASKTLREGLHKLAGPLAPSALNTPLGQLLESAAAPWVFHFIATTCPNLPGANVVQEAAELAMEAVGRDTAENIGTLFGPLFKELAASLKSDE